MQVRGEESDFKKEHTQNDESKKERKNLQQVLCCLMRLLMERQVSCNGITFSSLSLNPKTSCLTALIHNQTHKWGHMHAHMHPFSLFLSFFCTHKHRLALFFLLSLSICFSPQKCHHHLQFVCANNESQCFSHSPSRCALLCI